MDPRWGSLWMVHPFLLGPNFVSVTPSMGVLFPILRMGKVSTLWFSFFFSFTCFANCILYLGYCKLDTNISEEKREQNTYGRSYGDKM
jgi:hypothetical protein